MTTAHREPTAQLAQGDVVVLDYLAALWAESDDLSPELRDELMSTVAEYVSMRRTSGVRPLADPSEIVGRLGPPEALVAAVRRGHMPPHLRLPAVHVPPPAPAPARPATPAAIDYSAMGLLTVGSIVLPGIGPFGALMLVSGSSRWTPAQKAAAWVLCAGSLTIGLLCFLGALATDTAEAALIGYVVTICGSVSSALALLPGLVSNRAER